jgi:eukaryotic-like serine/threonine-protein kinase
MKRFLGFLKSKVFLKNLALAILTFGAITFIIFIWLKDYTNHDDTMMTPDFTGISMKDLEDFSKDHDVRFRIIDSVYLEKKPKGVVVRQDPEANSLIKHNRMIYLYVTATVPQQISMPNLIDASPRQAAAILESYGLKMGKPVMKPGQNAVLAQLYKGKMIAPGQPLPKGAVIELWIGKGEGDQFTGIPCLLGLTREEALELLLGNNLNEGAVICIDCKTHSDSVSAKIYRQSPGCRGDNTVSAGTSVDIFLTLDPTKLPIQDTTKTP